MRKNIIMLHLPADIIVKFSASFRARE